MMRLLLTLACCAAFAADAPVSVNRVIEIVRAGIQQKEPDKQLAKELAKQKLSERLESLVVEELESEGAGPASVEQLERMLEDSEGLKPPEDALPFDSPPKPPLDDMKAAIQAAREYALGYGQSLPDFLCTETIRRYEDLGPRGVWKLKDTLTLNLSYEDHRENYKLVAINNHATTASYRSMKGASSEGEFGNLMNTIFQAAAHPRISWDHWTKLRGRAAQVYDYAISVSTAGYELTFGEGGESVSSLAGSAGKLYLDPDSHAVLRITRRATDLPTDFPVTLAYTVLDYDYGEVGGRKVFLPARATIRLETQFVRTRNEVEFAGYRKFQGESTITFGDAPPAVVKK